MRRLTILGIVIAASVGIGWIAKNRQAYNYDNTTFTYETFNRKAVVRARRIGRVV